MFLAIYLYLLLSEIMFYTYVIIESPRAGAVLSKSLLITVVFNENYKNLNPKLTCILHHTSTGFLFWIQDTPLASVGVHVRLGWVALSLCGEQRRNKEYHGNIIWHEVLYGFCDYTEKVQSLYGPHFWIGLMKLMVVQSGQDGQNIPSDIVSFSMDQTPA